MEDEVLTLVTTICAFIVLRHPNLIHFTFLAGVTMTGAGVITTFKWVVKVSAHTLMCTYVVRHFKQELAQVDVSYMTV